MSQLFASGGQSIHISTLLKILFPYRLLQSISTVSCRSIFFLSSGFVPAVLWRNKKRHVVSHERRFGDRNGALEGNTGWLQWLLWFPRDGTRFKPEPVIRYVLTLPKWELPLLWARWRIEVCCCCLKNSANRFASTLYHFISSFKCRTHVYMWRLLEVELCPFKRWHSKPLVPQNVTLFGNRVIADIVKMRSCWIRVNPSYSRTAVLTKRRVSLWTGLCLPQIHDTLEP